MRRKFPLKKIQLRSFINTECREEYPSRPLRKICFCASFLIMVLFFHQLLLINESTFLWVVVLLKITHFKQLSILKLCNSFFLSVCAGA